MHFQNSQFVLRQEDLGNMLLDMALSHVCSSYTPARIDAPKSILLVSDTKKACLKRALIAAPGLWNFRFLEIDSSLCLLILLKSVVNFWSLWLT